MLCGIILMCIFRCSAAIGIVCLCFECSVQPCSGNRLLTVLVSQKFVVSARTFMANQKEHNAKRLCSTMKIARLFKRQYINQFYAFHNF